MVNNLSIFFMSMTLVISIFFPIILAIVFYKKTKYSGLALVAGILVFSVFQLVTRIPLLGVLANLSWYKQMSADVFLLGLFLGLTAGIFEEAGRFLGYNLLLKNKLTWKNGVAFGIGHGGIESITLVGLTMLNNIIFAFMINAGTFDATIAAKLPANTGAEVKELLINTAPVLFQIGGIERVLAIIIQIALSLMVLFAVMRRKYIYLFYAILLHTALDAPLIVYQKYFANYWIVSELYVLIYAAAAMIFIVHSRKHMRSTGHLTPK